MTASPYFGDSTGGEKPEEEGAEPDSGEAPQEFVTAASMVSRLPYGIPVPGKNGLVKSPFSDQGLVDVAGSPAQSEVRCPYTGKVFLVP